MAPNKDIDVHDIVEVYFDDGHWYPGEVREIDENNKVTVDFYDGDVQILDLVDTDLRLKRKGYKSRRNKQPKAEKHEFRLPLVGREEQLRHIERFITTHLNSHTGGALYICGSPGTGKTACVRAVLLQTGIFNDNTSMRSKSFRTILINGNTDLSSKGIYREIYRRVSGKEEIHIDVARNRLESLFKSSKKSHLIIIDEVDRLLTNDKEVLYQLFKWPKEQSSRVVLVAIANSVNLHNHFLPLLKPNNCEPEIIVFPAYTSEQLSNILLWKLKLSQKVDRFKHSAIELCARKVAAKSGDARIALDYCEIADRISKEKGKQNVDISHMSEAIKGSGNLKVVETLAQHAKYLLCAGLRFSTAKRQEILTVAKLYRAYKDMTKSWDLPQVRSRGEFDSVLNSLCQSGLVKLRKRPKSSDKRDRIVLIEITLEDAKYAMKESDSLLQILSQKSRRLHGANMYQSRKQVNARLVSDIFDTQGTCIKDSLWCFMMHRVGSGA